MKVVLLLSNEELTVGIYVPSYKRSDRILTYNLFEKCKYLVRKSEKQLYLNSGIPNEDLLIADDEDINGAEYAYFYIIEHAKEDVVVIADDDIEDMSYMLDIVIDLCKDKDTITSEVYRIAQLIYDLDIGMAFVGPNAIPYNYDREFAFKGIPGAVKWFNRNVFKGKIDPNVAYNFDIDLVMQELLNNRICLMPKYLYDKGTIDKNSGGESSKKRVAQLDSIINMKAKWGKYFDFDSKKNKPKINVKR